MTKHDPELWNGTERRENKLQITGFCPAHIDLVSDIAVIKNSAQNIEKTIVEGQGFRNGVTLSLISISLLLVLQIISFAYLYGQAIRQIEINTKRLDIIELQHRQEKSNGKLS